MSADDCATKFRIHSGEYALAAALLVLLLSTALPHFQTGHGSSDHSRDKSCRANLKQLDADEEMYAAKQHLPAGAALPAGCLWATGGFIKSQPECPSGGAYTVGIVGETPKCSIGGKHSLE
jgi:hypothetical protein